MAVPRQPGRQPVSWFVTRALFAIVVGLGIALVADIVRDGGPRPWLQALGVPPLYLGQGRLVDVGGRSMYLDCRGEGSPTVVFVSGMGDGASGWTSVHDEIAATTRACTFDRPGRGSSDPRGRHTLADAATDLRTMLDAAGEPGPFVVVGHSLGVDHTRVFADAYRDEIAGLVFVDGFTPDLQTDAVHPLIGDLRPEYEQGLDGLRDLVSNVEDLDWPTSEAQLRAADLDGLPIAVLRAPRGEPRLDDTTNEAIQAAVVASFEALSPGNVTYELAWGAGHMIQFDRPDLVIETVRRLVETARATG
jgi:pimeloyl-ACP methyl ester carboxylesterase